MEFLDHDKNTSHKHTVMLKRHSGEGNPHFRKHHTDEEKKKIADTNTKNARSVTQIDLADRMIAEYKSTGAAEEAVSRQSSLIERCRIGIRNKHRNFKWQYVTRGN